MKRIVCLFLALMCVTGIFSGCNSLNRKPVTLANNIPIPEDGIVSADIFKELKQNNKVVTFTGESGGLWYEWVIFGSELGTVRDLNLGLEIREATGERLAFQFLSKENFGFSPALSIYLKDVWKVQRATLTGENGNRQQVTITGKEQSILNFTPEVQTGSFMIIPDREADESSEPVGDSESENSFFPSSGESGNSYPPELQDPPVQMEESEDSFGSSESQRPVSDGKNTEQDQYKTDPVPEGKPLPAEPEDQKVDTKKSYTCTFSIECSAILNNLGDLDPDKLDILPKDGVIFEAQTVIFYEGESVYDVLERVCRESRIHMEASWTPMYNSAYVEGIGNLYEFDCGSGSGWMYRVDGWYPNYGCSRYQLKQGETVEWRYTCDLGKDIGGANAIGE